MKLNNNLIKDICDDVIKGAPPEDAALKHGLTRKDYHKYYGKGANATRNSLAKKFYDEINKAESDYIVKSIDIIGGGRPNWRARAWILERRFPERFNGTIIEKENDKEDTVKPILESFNKLRKSTG